MPTLLNFLKRSKLLYAFIIFLILAYAIYFYIYFYPITNNAFVVANYRPVAAQVSGYVDKIYVKNGEKVKSGQILFSINPEPYQYKVENLYNSLLAAKAELNLLNEQVKNNKTHGNAGQTQLEKQKYLINQITAKLKMAQYNLSQTKVYAQSNGIISNLFLAPGSPVKALSPLFSFIDTSQWWVQANFKETDIPEGIKAGDKANIRLRMYLGEKIYHGVITSVNWAVSRQHTDSTSHMQNIPPENQWVLLPQRFPVMIKILDPDPKFPLSVGASAYVTLNK